MKIYNIVYEEDEKNATNIYSFSTKHSLLLFICKLLMKHSDNIPKEFETIEYLINQHHDEDPYITSIYDYSIYQITMDDMEIQEM